MSRTRLALALAAALGSGCRAPSESSAREQPSKCLVKLEPGELVGQDRGKAVVYRGIPYAAPPVGELRFRPPAPVPPWSGVLEATTYGPKCPQRGLGDAVIGEEDCLSLNVWRPSADPPAGEAGHPVLVFIHGGSNVMGWSADPLHRGRTLAAEHGLVVVTFNYRLGLLGFLAHPALTRESGGSGNWAHLDQIAALQWVADNIAKFGGDPERVTLAGQSAGEHSVCALLGSPLAAGLFQRAILQSGGCDLAPLELREAQGERLMKVANCDRAEDPLACLRTRDPEALVVLTPPATPGKARGESDWVLPVGGAVDGKVFTHDPWASFSAQQHAVVPTLVGATADETELFMSSSMDSCAAYEAMIRANFRTSAAAVLARYPCEDDASARRVYVEVTTDALFGCQVRRTLRALAPAAGQAGVPLFRYVYAYTRHDPAVERLRAFHGGDLQLLFGTSERLGYATPDFEQELAQTIRHSWATFAATGSPVHEGTPGWTAWTPARDNALRFDATISTLAPVDGERCDFWDSLEAEPPASPK